MAKGMLFKNMEKEREKSGGDKIQKLVKINPNQLASFHCQNTITKYYQIKGKKCFSHKHILCLQILTVCLANYGP